MKSKQKRAALIRNVVSTDPRPERAGSGKRAREPVAKPFDPMALSERIGEIWQKNAG